MSRFQGLCWRGLVMITAALFSLAVPRPAEPGGCPAVGSRPLSPDEARALEAHVSVQPDDCEARSRLLEHYFLDRTPEGRSARRRHALWVIANAPESEIAGSPYAGFHGRLDAEGYQEARRLWLEHVEKEPSRPAVIANAARFFTGDDRQLAETLLRRGAELEPSNPEWHNRLGVLLMLDAWRRDGQPAEEASRRALAQFETALEKSEDVTRRYYMLADAAEAAWHAGKDDRARQHATELLRLAEELPKDWNYGNALHEGHRILGHVALRAGDVEGAKRHLLKAGATPGSPQLDSFGPELTLADALLAKGQTEAVIRYLELCAKFWDRRAEALDDWIVLIRAGKTPKLDRSAAARSER
jgi:hypothetical protein